LVFVHEVSFWVKWINAITSLMQAQLQISKGQAFFQCACIHSRRIGGMTLADIICTVKDAPPEEEQPVQ
jgi:hypothetical protein